MPARSVRLASRFSTASAGGQRYRSPSMVSTVPTTSMAKDHQQHPQGHGTHRDGNDAEQRQQQWVAPMDGDDAQRAPQQRGPQADVAVQVEPFIAVIPPAGTADPFQQVSGHPFQHGGIDSTEPEQENPALLQFAQSEADGQTAHAVQDAQRPVEHAPVLVAALAHGGGDHLAQPAQEGVGKEQVDKLIEAHTKILLFAGQTAAGGILAHIAGGAAHLVIQRAAVGKPLQIVGKDAHDVVQGFGQAEPPRDVGG